MVMNILMVIGCMDMEDINMTEDGYQKENL